MTGSTPTTPLTAYAAGVVPLSCLRCPVVNSIVPYNENNPHVYCISKCSYFAKHSPWNKTLLPPAYEVRFYRCLLTQGGSTPVCGSRPLPSLWSHVLSRMVPSLWSHVLSGGYPSPGWGGTPTKTGLGYPPARKGLGYPPPGWD